MKINSWKRWRQIEYFLVWNVCFGQRKFFFIFSTRNGRSENDKESERYGEKESRTKFSGAKKISLVVMRIPTELRTLFTLMWSIKKYWQQCQLFHSVCNHTQRHTLYNYNCVRNRFTHVYVFKVGGAKRTNALAYVMGVYEKKKMWRHTRHTYSQCVNVYHESNQFSVCMKRLIGTR